MKIALYGATGHSGSRILAELLRRGHTVKAISRHATEKIAATPGVTTLDDDMSDVGRIAEAIKGSDAVVSAYAPPQNDTDQLIGATERLVEAVEKNGGPRLVVVGGAASLFVAPGVTLLKSGHLPKEWVPIATSHEKVLENLKKTKIDWTYFSPAAFFELGEKTGKFRLGKDDLIADAQGNSRISMEDYAIGLVDELEKPQHRGQRFTIGY
jgi:putative NADH-flavin reductase